MGWSNGPPSWAEMERVLNGKPRHAGVPAFDADGDVPRSRKRGAYQPPGRERVGSSVAYAELHAHSAYSFLDGASEAAHEKRESVSMINAKTKVDERCLSVKHLHLITERSA
ncbi:hypothetical protein ABLN86_14405, partial [Mycobacterium tuberculosis]